MVGEGGPGPSLAGVWGLWQGRKEGRQALTFGFGGDVVIKRASQHRSGSLGLEPSPIQIPPPNPKPHHMHQVTTTHTGTRPEPPTHSRKHTRVSAHRDAGSHTDAWGAHGISDTLGKKEPPICQRQAHLQPPTDTGTESIHTDTWGLVSWFPDTHRAIHARIHADGGSHTHSRVPGTQEHVAATLPGHRGH